MTRLAFASVALVAAVLSAGAASASDHRIPIGDLDFATPQGAAAFDLRIRGFANTACVSGTQLDQARCRRDFREEALRQLPDAYRADYAVARTGRVVVRTPAQQQ